jgi:DNA-binding transcriptional MerR regulator
MVLILLGLRLFHISEKGGQHYQAILYIRIIQKSQSNVIINRAVLLVLVISLISWWVWMEGKEMVDNLFKTGDIAKFHNVSPDAVRYYDKEGLVKPSIVKENKYRYYNLNETVNFGNITMLRELNLPIWLIKKSLLFKEIEEVLSMNVCHMEDITKEIGLLQKRLDYLTILNARLRTFHEKPNMLVRIENILFYICKGMNFQISSEEVKISPSFTDESVDDIFWSRTSLISRVRSMNSDVEEMYCGNIIGSTCDLAEPFELKDALCYNYIGNPFKDLDYRERIDGQVRRYCEENQLVIGKECYEFIYTCLREENNYNYYIHLLYPIKNGAEPTSDIC